MKKHVIWCAALAIAGCASNQTALSWNAVGPAGPQGEGLMTGSLLFLPAGSPAPAGYSFIGTFNLQPANTNRGQGSQVQVDGYRRN